MQLNDKRYCLSMSASLPMHYLTKGDITHIFLFVRLFEQTNTYTQNSLILVHKQHFYAIKRQIEALSQIKVTSI